MEKKYLILTIVFIILALIVFFYPKNVGGPLCGPVCPSVGLHHYEKPCFGIKVRNTFIDGYSDTCYGLSIGEKKCYGVPYTNPGMDNIRLDCDYPCNDNAVKAMCQTQGNITIGTTTYRCVAINNRCNW